MKKMPGSPENNRLGGGINKTQKKKSRSLEPGTDKGRNKRGSSNVEYSRRERGKSEREEGDKLPYLGKYAIRGKIGATASSWTEEVRQKQGRKGWGAGGSHILSGRDNKFKGPALGARDSAKDEGRGRLDVQREAENVMGPKDRWSPSKLSES